MGQRRKLRPRQRRERRRRGRGSEDHESIYGIVLARCAFSRYPVWIPMSGIFASEPPNMYDPIKPSG